MRLTVESAWESMSKHGEELCGDTARIATTPDSYMAVLSDGLGSGVKANILSTLTAQIAETMFAEGAAVHEVVETLVETLPECQVRKLAYATFAVLRVTEGRDAYLVEYDSPPLILIRDNEIMEVPGVDQEVHGRIVRESHFQLEDGDYMVLVSDGYEHAGVGRLYRLGWGWQNIAVSVKRWVNTGCDAHELTHALTHTCKKLYGGQPGDDATAIAMRVRPVRQATVLTGPPANRARDGECVARLMARPGVKAICGGTTAQVAARELGKVLQVEWIPPSRRRGKAGRKLGTPPVAHLEGIDLVTEGILTLGQTLQLLDEAETAHDLPAGDDAACRLARILLAADEVHLIIGTALNPNQVADLVRGEPMRHVYVRELVQQLKSRKKNVTCAYI